MAVTLGFILVFAAGIAGAYFAGVQVARSSAESAPARSRPTKTGDIETKSDAQALATSVPADAIDIVTGPPDSNSAADQFSGNAEATVEHGVFSETRNFKRLAFPGTAVATIYPYPQALQSSCEPVRCTVLTRDLCRGGIGIAHTECLKPHQMIVLDAVGKLLVGEVRWCQRVDEKFYIAGCRLIKTTT